MSLRAEILQALYGGLNILWRWVLLFYLLLLSIDRMPNTGPVIAVAAIAFLAFCAMSEELHWNIPGLKYIVNFFIAEKM